MVDEVDNDFSFRDQRGFNEDPKDWINLPKSEANDAKKENR